MEELIKKLNLDDEWFEGTFNHINEDEVSTMFETYVILPNVPKVKNFIQKGQVKLEGKFWLLTEITFEQFDKLDEEMLIPYVGVKCSEHISYYNNL